MTLYCAVESDERGLSEADVRARWHAVLTELGAPRRVVALPPDYTRLHSYAGPLTCMTHEFFGSRLTDVMPALGTHAPMTPAQARAMFPGLPPDLIRVHRWREDVVTIGHVPADYVAAVTEEVWNQAWPVQLNRLIWEGGHDLIVSIGQVVPHEVVGMANYNKNVFVGTGGAEGINVSHFIGAAYGMERIMGRGDTPLRKILNYAQDHFCRHLPLLYALTVVAPDAAGQPTVRGLFIGDDHECFWRACALSARLNITVLDQTPHKVVAYLDPDEFHSTWLGNKAVYRTRMAIAPQGELLVLAPGVRSFGEDPEIDRLIRKYGYRTTPEIMQAVACQPELQANLSAAAHLIHGSSEERFRITYAPGGLSREEISGVGYAYAPLDVMLRRYPVADRQDGWQTADDGERYYFVRNPALGLWSSASLA